MLRSLLLSRNDAAIRIIARCFRDMEVELETSPDTITAIQQAAETRFDAIVIDDAIEDARRLLETVLELPSCNKSVRIALADPAVKMDSIFKTGTQVILYKPLSADRVRHGLRAVRNLMARERRRGAKRVQITINAKLTSRQSRIAIKQALIADLSDSGAAISVEKGRLHAGVSYTLEFWLPGNSQRLTATAEVVWQNNQGAAGLHFVDMPSQTRKLLSDWLKVNGASEDAPSAFASRAGR